MDFKLILGVNFKALVLLLLFVFSKYFCYLKEEDRMDKKREKNVFAKPSIVFLSFFSKNKNKTNFGLLIRMSFGTYASPGVMHDVL